MRSPNKKRASKLEPIKEIIIDSGIVFKEKFNKRGVRGIFGMIRGLKAYDIDNKGTVDADIFLKYLLEYYCINTM